MQEKEKGGGMLSRLLEFAGERRGLTIVGCVLSAVAMAVNMVPYVCIWLVIRDLVQGTPAELLAAGGTFARMVSLQGASAGWSV